MTNQSTAYNGGKTRGQCPQYFKSLLAIRRHFEHFTPPPPPPPQKKGFFFKVILEIPEEKSGIPEKSGRVVSLQTMQAFTSPGPEELP